MQAVKVERCEVIEGESTSCHGNCYFRVLFADSFNTIFFRKCGDFKVVTVELIPQNNWLSNHSNIIVSCASGSKSFS